MTARNLPSVADASGRRVGEEEIQAVSAVMRSGRLNRTVGGVTTQFEDAFAALYGVPYCTASTSGTAAIHLAVAAIDPNPGDEIITTGLSDAGTVIPILAQNAVPVFADVELATGMLDPESVRAAITERTKAIIAVHLFGAAARVEELRAIADEHGIALVEDCSQAYLTLTASGALAGTVGHVGTFSLQQSKHITTGDGGLTITSDRALHRRARLFQDKAWPRDTGERTHLFLGLNYRLTEMQSAMGLVQLTRLEGVVADRRRTAERFAAALAQVPGLTTLPLDGSSWWQLPVFADVAASGTDAYGWARLLGERGVPANPGYITRPLYLTPMLADARTYGDSGFPLAQARSRYVAGACPNTEALVSGGRMFVIPWNENYTDDDVDFLIAGLEAAARIVAG